MKSLSHVWLFATPWTVAYQALPSMEFSRQEDWSGLSFPSPRILPNPGIKPRLPALQVDASLSETAGKPISRGVNANDPRVLALWHELHIVFYILFSNEQHVHYLFMYVIHKEVFSPYYKFSFHLLILCTFPPFVYYPLRVHIGIERLILLYDLTAQNFSLKKTKLKMLAAHFFAWKKCHFFLKRNSGDSVL